MDFRIKRAGATDSQWTHDAEYRVIGVGSSSVVVIDDNEHIASVEFSAVNNSSAWEIVSLVVDAPAQILP